MSNNPQLQPVAVVGMSAIMPQAPDAEAFWANITGGRYCITDVPTQRWNPDLYYDADPAAPDKTYSRIGGWVGDFEWNPLAWKLPVPPTVAAQMDEGQKWAVAGARSALLDAGWPNWNVDPEKVAVIIGNAIGGEKHYQSCLRIESAEIFSRLRTVPTMLGLQEDVREAILAQARESFLSSVPPITEDTMPGELANIIAGRVANLFNFRGHNFTADAACASGLAALTTAVNGLHHRQYDAVITGGVDHNMNVGAFVKFCKIGALSATGTRPFDAGADGFVMGEGCALFVLKRLADAERDGDRIYAVVLGIGGSSDGRGRGITAPNPLGQRLAVERAWNSAEVDPAEVGLVEGHGTSTRAGDASELASLTEVLAKSGAEPGSVALGSVKSNIGHLKAAAGAAGLFKLVRSLHEKVLPPSLNFVVPNPNVDWAVTPLRVNTELREWDRPAGGIRRGGVSAFGFGGTNFHVAVEEYVPGRYDGRSRAVAAGVASAATSQVTGPPATSPASASAATSASTAASPAGAVPKAPLRGALVLGGADDADVVAQLRHALAEAQAGRAPEPAAPDPATARSAVRVAVDHGDAADLAAKLGKTLKAFSANSSAMFRMLRSQGVFVGRGPAPRVAFLYTGQGSQYVNMLAELRRTEPVVAKTFDEADAIMTPLLGCPLSSYIFIDATDPQAVARLEQQLLQTEITQPAVLATDLALTRLLTAYGITPDLVMGHSLGEYGALMVAGSLSFGAALEAVSARGHEMASLDLGDNGAMAAVFGPLGEIERAVAGCRGHVVIANINSNNQAVIGGATDGVEEAIGLLQDRGINATRIPVSHAFHTSIVAPASEPLKVALRRLDITGPTLPTVANVTGQFYPRNADVDTMLDILGRQVASPVQFVQGLHTLYDAGARLFVEVGPKKALAGFVDDVLGTAHDDVVSLFTNHPKLGDVVSFNQALCGMYAAGLGLDQRARDQGPVTAPVPPSSTTAVPAVPAATAVPAVPAGATVPAVPAGATGPGYLREEGAMPATPPLPEPNAARYAELGRLLADVLEQGIRLCAGQGGVPAALPAATPIPASAPGAEPVVVTGAALGLPGVDRVFDDENVGRILAGQQFIDLIPSRFRQRMADMHISRLVKNDETGASFETIDSQADVVKLAGRHAPLDVVTEFGVDAARDAALDNTTRMAIGSGFDALRDAGLPLVMHYKTTTLGTHLPDRWGLPEALRDDTGVIFASAFPGYDNFAADIEAYLTNRARREQLLALEAVRSRMRGDEPAAAEADRRIAELRQVLRAEPHTFDRRFLFRALSMGHSQFAEIVGARGPNTQVNAACASTTQAVALAEDWIRAGRCRRVVIVSADDATADHLLPWLTAGFLASGAAATDDVVEDVATPFDRRRHGMVVGTGAAAFVVESAEAARERGVQPICEVLGTVTANSAFHGTRLDVDHIGQVMETLLRQAEARGVRREVIAGQTVFVSHETYTPARGGSAAAEINALRRTFAGNADRVVITNTKGFTGHAMGAGIEDVVAIKSLETGIVPAVPNYKEPDPELGTLNLSQGGAYPVEYALRLAAGFGSQIAMTLLHRTPVPDGRRRSPGELGYAYRIVDPAAWQRWLDLVSGHPGATLEVSQRRLRVVDTGPARTAPTTPPAIALPASAPPAPPAPVVPPPVVSAPTGPAPTGPAPETPAAAPAVPSMRAPVPSAPSAPSAPAPAESASDPVIGEVVRMVSQMTGYPPELLDLDLDLEADLGVDTVKQAEVFAAVRERWDIPRQDDLRLRDFPTLNHVIAWVHDKTGATATPPTDGTPELAPAAPSAPAAEAADPVVEQVVQIVSQMTGYPPELLDLDLDLEADLGVDTVKQAEVFAAVRERWDIPRQDDLRLRDFPTLNHVIAWVHDKTGATATPPTDGTPTAPATPAAEPQPTDRQRAVPQVSVVRGDLTATDRIPRRTPVPMLRPDLSQCTPTGVTLESGTRAVVALDEGGVGDLLVKKLRRRGVDVLGFEPGTATEEILAALDGWLTEGAVHGVFWLPALDDEGPLEQLDPVQWHEALRRRVKALYATMRRLYDGSPFLITGTRMGGFHGYDAAGATAPLGGAVTGFAKSYRRERPEALVKAVDVPAGRRTAAVADLLIEEALRDPGCVEVGLVDDRRWGVGLVERPFPALEADGRPDGEGGLRLGPQTVVAVTGAAGSIVSAITADLAAVSGGVFHLLDLTPAPDPEDPDLRLFVEDREALKAALAGRLRTTGERPTPVAIDKELARFERLQMALAAIRAVEQAGGTAHYHCVDLTDSEAVAEVMRSVRELSGRIDVLLHAAGLEISRNLPDKQPREYDLVFDVKSDGFFNVLAGAGDLPIGATVVFSSVAGRFGNAGQTDYSAANDLMCKIISSFRRTRPGTRGIALDWTAWGTIGMATRGSIPKIMEQAGVQLLPAEAGVAWTRRELSASPFRGEVVVAGELGLMAAEFHPTGGLDLTAVSPEGCGPMVDTVEKLSVHDGLVVSTTLDPTAQPFLDHHRIDGTAVLPGVMGMEGFAEAAALLAPGWRVAGLEDVTFANPVKFYRDEPRTLTISALLQPDDGVQGSTDGEVLLADCRLTAQRQLPGSDVPQTTAHFAGRVRLCRQPAREPGTTPDTGPAAQENGLQEKGAQENGVQEKGAQENGVQENGAPRLGPDDVYALYFHGPAYQVVSAAWREGPDAVARLNDGLGPDHRPEEVPLLIGPRLVELCFQDAGLWEAGNTGRLALPMRVARLRLLADPAATPQGPVHATARPGSEGTGAEVFDCAVVDGSGRVLLRMDGYATVALPSPVAGELGARLHEVMGPVPAPAEG